MWPEMYQPYLATVVNVFGGYLSRGLLKLHQTAPMLLIDRIAQMYIK